MTASDPPQRHPPAGAVRDLLEAIHDYLDLPFVADWDEEPKRDAELQECVTQLVEWLEVALADGTVEDALETVRAGLATALLFTPESPAQTAERHARLAARLAELRRSRLTVGADRGPDGQQANEP